MAMSNSADPFDRVAFRRNLGAALSESLLDVGDIEDAARRAPVNVHHPDPHNMSLQSRPSLAYLPPASAHQGQSFFPQQQQHQQQYGGSNDGLLLAVAQQQEQARLLEEARAAVLVAQERERLLQQTLLQNKMSTPSGPMDPPRITDALRYNLFSQAPQQHPQEPNNFASLMAQGGSMPHHHALAQSVKDNAPKIRDGEKVTKALETLGRRLRNPLDPYIDVSSIIDEQPLAEEEARQAKRTRGGVTEPFPEKLHRMLQEVEAEGKTDIVSFFPHGRAFAVHNMDRFVAEIMPRFFKQSKWNSFARQLNLYGFQRMLTGTDAGGYYHELFLKGRPHLVVHMRRVGVPHGKDRRKFKQPQVRTAEPDFYSMKKITPVV